jgi:flagellar biosynthesis protein FlhB
MAEQDQNRNEAATPHKLEEARKKGSVPKSLDINSFMVLGASVATLYLWGARITDKELALFANIFSHTHQASFEISEFSGFLTQIFTTSLSLLTPLFLLLFVLGALANLMQVGPIFSFFPLKPDFDRVNPVAGLKRMFSVKLLIEAIKTILKFILLGAVLYSALSATLFELLSTFQMHPATLGRLLLPMAAALLLKLLLAFAAIAAIDLIYSRWDFGRRMRMSRREITDEHKRREGDPRIKSRLRELQREAVKRAKSLGRVKDADVLITNPIHFAVAIKYD